jgi:hypothetical protein
LAPLAGVDRLAGGQSAGRVRASLAEALAAAWR